MTRTSRCWPILTLLLATGCEGLLNDPRGPGDEQALASARGTGAGAGGGSVQALCGADPLGSRASLRLLTPVQYESSVRDLFGAVITPSKRYPQPSGVRVTGFSTDAKLNSLGGNTVEALADAAEETALDVMAKLDSVLDCASDADRACAEKFVDTYARRAFRRPLTTEQRNALLGLYDDAMKAHGKFPVAIAELTSAILQSPEFIYLPELGTQVADGIVQLDGYELASRLSYLFWDTLPDEALLAAAEKGELASPDGLRAQAERLVKDARFDKVIQRFVREWTELKVYEAGQKDPAQFPSWDGTLASSVQEELDRFVSAALHQGEGGYEALLAGRESFVNEPLAALYGLPASTSSSADDWQKVTLPAERAGLLTRAAVLAGLAGNAVPSHVRRGKFVRLGLLCTPLGAPPPNAMQMQPDYPASASTRRARSEILQKVPQCGGCHTQLDRIGLAFDDFDAIGAKVSGEVDVSGEILYGGDMTGPFHGSAELAQKLVESETVRACVVKHWFRYSFGRLEDMNEVGKPETTKPDHCTYDDVVTELDASKGDLASTLASLAATDGFRFRKLTKESP